MLIAVILVALLPLALAACAGVPARAPQVVEVHIEAEDVALLEPLECKAFNAAGEWAFVAPGTVTVKVSSPLRITCKLPPGMAARDSTTWAGLDDASREAVRKGEKAGALAGGAVGVAAVVAATPVVGAGFGLLVGLKAIWDGSQLGGAAGWIGSGAGMAYPSPIVLRIGPAGPWAESRPVPIPGPYGPKGR